MACGTPVAVADATSLPEVVGDAGLFFDPFKVDEIEESISQLMRDISLREKLIEKSRKQIRRFDWIKSAMTIYKYYHKTSINT